MAYKNYLLAIVFALSLLLNGCIDSTDFQSISTPKGLGKKMLPRFIAHGALSSDVSQINKKLDARPTDNWCVAWSDLAQGYADRAQQNIDKNNLDDAKYFLLKAAVYYRIASYPFPLDAERKSAGSKSAGLFKQYTKFMDNPPKVITLSTETRKIVGYFRRPSNDKKVPLVILLPGLDSSKEEMFFVEEHFLDKGFATFSVDIPGTGESEWPLRSDSDLMFQKIIKYFQEDNTILPDKISLVGFNFGGYWALRAAAKNSGLSSVVAVSSPINQSFALNRLNQMPKFMIDTMVKITGATDYQEMFNILTGLALKDEVKDISCPVLIINPGRDIFIADEESTYLAEQMKKPINLKIYLEQKFGFIENLQSEVYPLAANWVEEKFER